MPASCPLTELKDEAALPHEYGEYRIEWIPSGGCVDVTVYIRQPHDAQFVTYYQGHDSWLSIGSTRLAPDENAHRYWLRLQKLFDACPSPGEAGWPTIPDTCPF